MDVSAGQHKTVPMQHTQQMVLRGSVPEESVYNDPDELPQHLAIQITA